MIKPKLRTIHSKLWKKPTPRPINQEPTLTLILVAAGLAFLAFFFGSIFAEYAYQMAKHFNEAPAEFLNIKSVLTLIAVFSCGGMSWYWWQLGKPTREELVRRMHKNQSMDSDA